MGFIIYDEPHDAAILETVGRVAFRHGHLHYEMRLLLKSLTEVTVAEAMDATARDSFGSLCDRVRKLARQRLGEGPDLIRVQALIECAKRETQKRNDVIHSVCGRDIDGSDAVLLGEGGVLRPFPSVDEMTRWAATFAALASAIGNARQGGYIQAALRARPRS
jgi:hypothetical protein